MRRIDFTKIVLMNEAAPSDPKIDWSAEQLFKNTSGEPNPKLTAGFLPREFKSEYTSKFAVGFPNDTDLQKLVTVMNANVLSRGGSKQYEPFAHYFPLMDLMFIVMESNSLGAGDFIKNNTLSKRSFEPNSPYGLWIKQLKNIAAKPYPLDWEPLSGKGIEVKRQISKDELQKYASQLVLKNYGTKSILYAITQLLEVRKELRWNVFKQVSSLKIPFTKTRDRVLPTKILDIFRNPTKYAGGITQFPADIKNRYDNSGGLEEQIHNLALTCNLFFEAERGLYFGETADDCKTEIIEVLDNIMLEAGDSAGLFNFIRISTQEAVPAEYIGTGGYTINNLEKYANDPRNPQAKKLWEKLESLANYTKTNTFSARDIAAGAGKISKAIGGFAGSFGT